MGKKVFNIFGSIFALLTFAVMFFPWLFSYCEGKYVSADITTTGFGLMQFSVWGAIMFIIPVMIFGVTCSKLSKNVKTVFLMGLYLLGSVSFYYATTMGIEWLREVSTEYVRAKFQMFLYPIFMFFSLLSFYLSYNTKNCSFLNMIGIEVINEDCKDIGELYLCSTPYMFGKFKNGEELTMFPGCVSFITDDGYFSALGHDEDYACIKHGCIEVFRGDDTAGFVMQIRTTGVYGALYEGHNFDKDTKIGIAPFNAINTGTAELWIPGKFGFMKKPVEITPNNPAYIACKLSDGLKLDANIDGAVIVQGGKAVAVVSEYDVENDTYNCVSASKVALPLIYMAREQTQLEKETSAL